MSILVITQVACEQEGCHTVHKNGTGEKSSPRSARKTAKDSGWSRVGGKDYCPDHKPVWKKVLVPAS